MKKLCDKPLCEKSESGLQAHKILTQGLQAWKKKKFIIKSIFITSLFQNPFNDIQRPLSEPFYWRYCDVLRENDNILMYQNWFKLWCHKSPVTTKSREKVQIRTQLALFNKTPLMIFIDSEPFKLLPTGKIMMSQKSRCHKKVMWQ